MSPPEIDTKRDQQDADPAPRPAVALSTDINIVSAGQGSIIQVPKAHIEDTRRFDGFKIPGRSGAARAIRRHVVDEKDVGAGNGRGVEELGTGRTMDNVLFWSAPEDEGVIF